MLKKFLKSLYAKIIALFIGVAVLACAGYGVYTYFTPAEEAIKEVEVIKEITIDKIVEVPIEVEVFVEVEKIVEVIDPDLIEAAQELRAEKIDGFVEALEDAIESFEEEIENIDEAIDEIKDEIADKQDDIDLLAAQINSKQSLIDFYTETDYVGYLEEIRALEDEVIDLKKEVGDIEDIIEELNEDIADLEETKEPWIEKIELDEKCIAEVGRYIEDGSEYSDDVEERFEALNLI